MLRRIKVNDKSEWIIILIIQFFKVTYCFNRNRSFLLIIFYNMIEGEPKRKLKKLELSDFSLETTLGSGSYGKVKLARRKKDGAVLCVKSMKKAEIIESKQTDHIINECNIISQINHPMIVTLFSYLGRVSGLIPGL